VPGRSYENSQRSRQAAATRDRILAAATEIVHGLPPGDWRDLTVRAVARRAGVDESTVYRHFSTERNLRDAVLRSLVNEAGVKLEDLRLENFGEVLGQTFAYLSTFPASQTATSDPSFAALDERRRTALLTALAEAAPDWTEEQCTMAAAAVDAYWSVPVFERMINTWGLDSGQATRAVTWVIDLIRAEVRDGGGPGRDDPAGGLSRSAVRTLACGTRSPPRAVRVRARVKRFSRPGAGKARRRSGTASTVRNAKPSRSRSRFRRRLFCRGRVG
jgi:AcrR family transcriptional regulator